MTISLRIMVFLSAALLVAVPLKGRAGDLQSMDLHLVMSMAGVTAGSLMLSIDPGEGGIETRLKMKSQGLFKLLTGYKSRSAAVSTHGDNGHAPMPISYDSTFETNKTDRKVLIRYDDTDGNITDYKAWKRGKPRKSKVLDGLQHTTIDPLTTVLQLRHWIRDIRRDGAGQGASPGRSFEIFDGRRHYRLAMEILDRREVRFDGKKRPALRFKVVMEPVAGFSSKDLLANWASEDGKNWIELLVTDEDDPLPISVETKGGSLQTTVHLRKICIGDDKCNKVDS